MGVTVGVNKLSVVHASSNGITTALPDVCNTPAPPAPPIPIPYPNVGQASDTSSGPSTVTTDGQMPMTQDAKYSKSSGDEVGSATGVISSKVMGTNEAV